MIFLLSFVFTSTVFHLFASDTKKKEKKGDRLGLCDFAPKKRDGKLFPLLWAGVVALC